MYWRGNMHSRWDSCRTVCVLPWFSSFRIHRSPSISGKCRHLADMWTITHEQLLTLFSRSRLFHYSYYPWNSTQSNHSVKKVSHIITGTLPRDYHQDIGPKPAICIDPIMEYGGFRSIAAASPRSGAFGIWSCHSSISTRNRTTSPISK